MNNKYFAGIGSRSAPQSFKELVDKIAPFLVKKGYVLRSGGADGADFYWENAYDNAGVNKEIYLPWHGFNENKSRLLWEQADWDTTKEFHPRWESLKLGARQLMARNTCQLGIHAETMSSFVCCWTEDGKGGGGTGQALRLANHYKIKIFDFGDPKTLVKFRKFCKTL